MEHVPVLISDVEKYLRLAGGETVVDATLGLGGHAKRILKCIGQKGKLIAFEQDERNLKEAEERLKDYKKQIVFIHDNFRYLKTRVTEQVDAILFDLGLSSPHVDDEKRGFSFAKDGPLDMRFDPRGNLTAFDVVNHYVEEKLANVLWEYGEERFSRRIAKAICMQRAAKPFKTTLEFADFLKRIMHGNSKKIHPATRIFQAIRIEVNDELNALKEALEGAFDVLVKGGRIVVISYHSLEDRIVKNFFKDLLKPKATPEESIYRTFGDPLVMALTKKPVTPTEEEIAGNPRSRSAKLRAYEKLI